MNQSRNKAPERTESEVSVARSHDRSVIAAIKKNPKIAIAAGVVLLVLAVLSIVLADVSQRDAFNRRSVELAARIEASNERVAEADEEYTAFKDDFDEWVDLCMGYATAHSLYGRQNVVASAGEMTQDMMETYGIDIETDSNGEVDSNAVVRIFEEHEAALREEYENALQEQKELMEEQMDLYEKG